MVRAVRQRWLAAAFAGLMLATACDDAKSPEPLAPLDPQPNAQLAAGGATLAVDVTSTGTVTYLGSDLDPDGYTVWVGRSLSQAIGTNGLAAFSGLSAGDHVVALYDMTFNCVVYTMERGSNNPRTVSLVDGVGGSTDYSVGCGPWGGLFVTATTTGVDLDTDGYAISVDGGTPLSVGANGDLTFTDLYEGNHAIAISGVATNCSLSGASTRTITVTPGGMASLALSANCAPVGPGTGTLTVVATSTGSNLPAGYTATVDGSLSQPIGAGNDSVTFTVPAGNHPVDLADVPSNCVVGGANPRTVTMAADGAARTTFEVTCAAPQAAVIGGGQLGMGAPTPHNNVQTFEADLRADLTGRFAFTDYSNIHPSDNPASLYTDPAADPATGFTAYRSTSNACSDPSRGAEFDALGREDEGPVVSYTVIVCDEGPKGSGADFVSFFIPSERYGRSGIVTSGDLAKR